MALKKSVLTVYGIQVKNAYHRVEGLVLENKNEIKFNVRASVSGIEPHFSDNVYYCKYNLEGKNPFEQAYEYLKSLPDFADAVDC